MIKIANIASFIVLLYFLWWFLEFHSAVSLGHHKLYRMCYNYLHLEKSKLGMKKQELKNLIRWLDRSSLEDPGLNTWQQSVIAS